MARLDAKFYGTIRKAKDDTMVPPDRYVVFLAQDNAFAAILPLYREKAEKLGADERQLIAVDELIVRVNDWRAANPDKCKVPDVDFGELFVS